MTAISPGPSSIAGLEWLAQVGPSPQGAWGIAMEWGQAAVYSHTRRLRASGWLESCPRLPGDRKLVYPSPAGHDAIELKAAGVDKTPAPVTWPHLAGCAWTAAWLTTRGRDFLGPRELIVKDDWSGELSWRERGETRRRGHRPDLAGAFPDGRFLPIEVELTEKSTPRLQAVIGLHADWVASGKTPAVMYVCASDRIAERVKRDGLRAGLSAKTGTLRVELLATIQAQAVAARSKCRATQWHLADSAVVI